MKLTHLQSGGIATVKSIDFKSSTAPVSRPDARQASAMSSCWQLCRVQMLCIRSHAGQLYTNHHSDHPAASLTI